MTRVSDKNALVLDGDQVKLRLIAERIETKTSVHVDWLRFTVRLRNAPPKIFDRAFSDVKNPTPEVRFEIQNYEEKQSKVKWIHEYLRELEHDAKYSAAGQAYDLALRVVECLGLGFEVAQTTEKGHDFYAKRWPILYGGQECGWVGFGTSSESPRQKAQASTMHVNLYGKACTFAPVGWRDRMAALCEETKAEITRIDLALDFFDGHPDGDIKHFEAEYHGGLFDCDGRRPTSDTGGKWWMGHSRSFYVGSREYGKITNVYEKGHQLYGHKSGSNWLRMELRYGNKFRELDIDALRNPSAYFAGASEWHARQLRLADSMPVVPQESPTKTRLAIQTVEAEAYRVLRWTRETAGASIALAFQFLDEDAFLELVNAPKLPGRLKGFGLEELKQAYRRASRKVLMVGEESPVPA